MNQTKNRRSESRPIPTLMMQAVSGMSEWKLAVMFVFGMGGMAVIIYWFAFPAEGHEHGMVELIAAGAGFAGCAFFAFPLGITRLADKYVPAWCRKERRVSSAE